MGVCALVRSSMMSGTPFSYRQSVWRWRRKASRPAGCLATRGNEDTRICTDTKTPCDTLVVHRPRRLGGTLEVWSEIRLGTMAIESRSHALVARHSGGCARHFFRRWASVCADPVRIVIAIRSSLGHRKTRADSCGPRQPHHSHRAQRLPGCKQYVVVVVVASPLSRFVSSRLCRALTLPRRLLLGSCVCVVCLSPKNNKQQNTFAPLRSPIGESPRMPNMWLMCTLGDVASFG